MEGGNLSYYLKLIYLNTSLDYETFKKLNGTVHTLLGKGELHRELFKNEQWTSTERESLDAIVALTVVYAAVLIVGFLGNIITCIVISRNRSMHTPTNYYLFSLAVSDMVLLLSGLPSEVYRLWYPEVYVLGETSCRLFGLLSETSANATVLTITAFTIERYIAICHPFLSRAVSELSRVLKFIIGIWIAALCLAVPQVLQFGVLYSWEGDRIISSCTVKWEIAKHAFEISGFVFFVGPMTAITVLYLFIGIKLRKSQRLRRTNTGDQLNACKNPTSQRRVIKMLVAVAVSFFICWAPFHAQRLLAVYGADLGESNALFLKIYKPLMYTSGILYFLSTAINPFLYNIMSKKFRVAFKNTIYRRKERDMQSHKFTNSSRRSTKNLENETKNDKCERNQLRNKHNRRMALLADFARIVLKRKSNAGAKIEHVNCPSVEKIKLKNNSVRHSCISNSSLKNGRVDEYTETELATFIQQINNDTYYAGSEFNLN